MIGLDQQMDVYVPDGVTGDWTVGEGTAVACRLVMARTAAAPGPERAEVESGALLMWGPRYAMPENAQVEIEGKRWDVQGGTVTGIRDMSSRVIYQRADVVAVV